MGAGRGIVHSERTPAGVTSGRAGLASARIQPGSHCRRRRRRANRLSWHHPGRDLPEIRRTELRPAAIAGEGWGERSPVAVSRRRCSRRADLAQGAVLELPDRRPSACVYVAAERSKSVTAVTRRAELIEFAAGTAACRALKDSRVIVAGGRRSTELDQSGGTSSRARRPASSAPRRTGARSAFRGCRAIRSASRSPIADRHAAPEYAADSPSRSLQAADQPLASRQSTCGTGVRS